MTGRDVAVVIPAAGLSTRFGRNKLHEPLAGFSVLRRSIDVFLDRPDTALLVLATPPGREPTDALPPDAADRVREAGDRVRLVEGGPDRASTVRAALATVPPGVPWVAVHDAARPLTSAGLVDRMYAHARTHGSAVPAMPVKLTIKRAAGPLPATVVRTLPRAELWEMQTPQVMRRSDLIDAFGRCSLPLADVTDDAQLLEAAGLPVWLVPGEERNIKLTTPADLVLAETLLALLGAEDAKSAVTT